MCDQSTATNAPRTTSIPLAQPAPDDLLEWVHDNACWVEDTWVEARIIADTVNDPRRQHLPGPRDRLYRRSEGRYERYDRLGQIDGAAIVENKRLGHALKAALILQAQRDDRRLKAPSRTHRGKASQPLRAAPGTKPASQFTPEDMAIAVRQVCGLASAPKPRAHRHPALATT